MIQNFSYRFIKRSIDFTGALIGLIIFFPLFLILPLVIKAQSSGPVFFKRKVLGQKGKLFSAFKFRTMVKNADEILRKDQELNERYLENFKLKKDPRITTVGYFLRRYSLDEIPQFFNVLKGQMSIVGPRMMTAEEIKLYGDDREKVLGVRPGMTGVWQVSGRQDVPFARRKEMDLDYINNWHLMEDILILFKTIPVVINGWGAY
jgi:lipopolysaccharide/colanic/teichoic acid biosynthesis glycosyltransferase